MTTAPSWQQHGPWRFLVAPGRERPGFEETLAQLSFLIEKQSAPLVPPGRPGSGVALAMVATRGGFHFPTAAPGWWGLAALTFLYGTAFTIMFTVLPRLGVVGNSAIMNVEPVFALVLAWLLLDQAVAPVQVAGALLVVGAVMALGLRRR